MLKLPIELAITQVETLHQDLLQELSANDDICLDNLSEFSLLNPISSAIKDKHSVRKK